MTDSSRRGFFRLGSRQFLRKLADIAAPSLDALLKKLPDAKDPASPPLSADEAGHALRTMRKKRPPNQQAGS